MDKIEKCSECGHRKPGHSLLCAIGIAESTPKLERPLFTQAELDTAVREARREVWEKAIQAIYTVRNKGDGWPERLVVVKALEILRDGGEWRDYQRMPTAG